MNASPKSPNRLAIVAATLLCGGWLLTPASLAAAGVEWKGPESVASVKQDQELLVYFRMDSSTLCRELEEDVWSDATIAADARAFAPVKLDVQSAEGRRIASQYKVYRVPSIVISKRDGTIVRRLDQSSDKAAVAKFLRGTATAAAASSTLPFSTVTPGGGTPATAATAATPAPAAVAEASDAAGDATPATRDITGVKVRKSAAGFEVEVLLAGAPGKDMLSNYSIFLNTDNSTATGFVNTRALGAEWMVEGLNVFKFSGAKPDVWAWDQKGTVEARIEGNSVIYQLAAKQFGGMTGGFTLFAGTHDEKWNAVDWAPEQTGLAVGAPAANPPGASQAPAPQEQPAAAAAAADSNPDPTGDGTATHDIVSVDVKASADPVVITFQLAKPISEGVLHLFIDPDNNPSTGYSDGSRSGADLMLEGSTLYRHTQPGWNWNQVGEIAPAVSGARITYTIPRSRIGLEAGKPANLWFCISDKSWKPVDYVPDSGLITIH